MSRLARRAGRCLRRLIAREDGTATVEFVVLFPVFMMVLVNAVEASVLMSRVAMLDRALDLAVRELRIGTDAPATEEGFRALVCQRMPEPFRAQCVATLQVELQPAPTAGEPAPDTTGPCGGRYAPGLNDQLMMVRACLVARPVVPNLGLAALLPSDAEGFRLVAVSAFVQEPYRREVGA